MDFEDDEVIVLTDDDGEEHEFNLIDTITVNEKEYAILQPVDEEEAIILRFGIDDEGDEVLYDIEDDEEWERVADAWQEISEEEDV
ncbi:MAG: DUF1292 domain-containing protein [Thermacetogeniaceae bacterium]|jgi:uncharacterized protein YrzB (UPF0473 family)